MVKLVLTYAAIYAPALVSLIGIILIAVKVIKKLQEFKSNKELEELKGLTNAILKDNYSLKKQIKELTQSMTKVKQKEE